MELALRSGGVALGLALLLALGTRQGWRRHGALLAVVACACAYLVCSAPGRPCCAAAAMLPVLLGAAGFPFAFWRLVRVVLADERTIPWPAWVAGAVLLAGAVAAVADFIPAGPSTRAWGAIFNKAAALGFLAAALHEGWRSREGDLVEPRRRLRWAILGYVGGYGLMILLAELYLLGSAPPAWMDTANVALIAASLLATLLFLLQPREVALDALLAPPPGKEIAAASAPPRIPDAGATADDALLERLRDQMDRQKAYRDPELSLATLAARVAVPEYVLRRVIHRHLGYRNFPAYVNDHRLQEVAERLRDPLLLRRPVLTLALESGFGSIGPFNRAFKARYGATPTEWRQAGTTLPLHGHA